MLNPVLFLRSVKHTSTTTDVTLVPRLQDTFDQKIAISSHFKMKNSTFSPNRIKKQTYPRWPTMFKILHSSKITISKFWFHKHFKGGSRLLEVRTHKIDYVDFLVLFSSSWSIEVENVDRCKIAFNFIFKELQKYITTLIRGKNSAHWLVFDGDKN